jgi:hypothetical protein
MLRVHNWSRIHLLDRGGKSLAKRAAISVTMYGVEGRYDCDDNVN